MSRRTVLAALCWLAFVPSVASAHVDYVVDDPQEVASAVRFLVETVTTPLNAALLGGGAVAAALVAAAYLRYRPLRRDVAVFRAAMDEYRDLLPWLLRLSLGLPLVGAGFAGYLFSPAVAIDARLLQVGIGFLLLFGLATRAVAVAGLAVYLAALVVHPRLVIAGEYVPAFLAIAILGGGRPSADHVLQRVASADGTVYGRLDPIHGLAARFHAWVGPYRSLAPTIVRVGLGAVFLYLGFVQKLVEPGEALGVVAKYDLTAVVPVEPALWVVGAGLAEMLVGTLLIVGLFTRAASGVSIGLFATTLLALPDDPVLAHVSLFGLASALLITGSGPLAVDRRLADETGDATAGEPDDGTASTPDPTEP